MKKMILLFSALVLALSLCACSGNGPAAKEFAFPENTYLLGVDISGMSKEAGFAALEAKTNAYALELSVDGIQTQITGADIGLTCSREIFMACADAMEQGITPDYTGMITFNDGKLRLLLSQQYNKAAADAAVIYDETAGQYVLVPHADGQKSNPNAIAAELKDALTQLEPQKSLTEISEILHPVRSADSEEVTQALAQANKMISTQLTYTFTPDGDTITHQIPAETIRSFVTIAEDGFTPVIHQDNLDTYVTELSDKYSIEGTSGSFQTTGGGTVGLTVSYNGNYVDNSALAEDIIACINEGVSETRTAPYQPSGNRDMAYGGTYVEVNLSSQHLWFYKNGECIVSTALVSGMVAENMCTPTGVYSLYHKKTGAYLEGDDYRTYVNYWMPFYGGYGLHDATWRSSFGGDIYLYGGSHGCVNLPLSAAAKIYNNISVGTKVILYGGERSVPPVTQKLTGTTSYDVADDSGSFKLNIKPKYKGRTLSYASDNPSVASVTSDGTVTVNGIGTATITVTAPKHSYYTEATTTVTVKVHSACDEGRHQWGSPTVVTPPTCQPGLEKVTCKRCGYSAEQEMSPTETHTYGDWIVTKEPTCGAEGTKERLCTKCNIQKETGSVPATGNHTESDWVTTLEPTCVKDGAKQTHCTVCGTPMSAAVIPATGVHAAGDWQTVTPPTCDTPGTKHKCCIHCGLEMETGTIDPGHKSGDWETAQAPTCTTEGKKVKKCTACGKVLEEATIGKKDHNFNGGPACVDCGAANPNYAPAPTGTGDDEDEEA